MFEWLFHSWERRLVAVTKDRVVRPFEWGLNWIPQNGHAPDTPPSTILREWSEHVLADTDTFFAAPPLAAGSWQLEPANGARRPRRGGSGDILRFPSALTTPHPANNVVTARYFRAHADSGPRPAVLVLPQWNADVEGHIAICRLLARLGISALRLSLPYHDRRMPAELHRADYIVSANIGRTLQVCRQAVLDAKRAIDWLVHQGHGPIGILGTSLGSCLSMLTAAHDPRIRVAALNHVSSYFADVVWAGLSTQHVRQGLEEHIDLDRLRSLWLPISPHVYLNRVRDRKLLFVYARYDLTFPVDLSRRFIEDCRRRAIPHELTVLPCGHYSTAIAPFSWMDGFVLTRFLRRHLGSAGPSA